MKVLVTGATGFIGRQLSYQLAQSGYKVHALCRNEEHPYLMPHKNIEVFKGDILDKESLLRAMRDCDQVYHTAALAKMWCRNKSDYYDINVAGTRNVLDAAKYLDINRVVYTSTCGIIGPTVKHPMSESDPRIIGFSIDYERTKYLAEIEVRACAEQGMNVVIVYPSRVFGEGPITDSNTVGKMVSGYLKGKWRIIPGTGNQVANYAYLNDVVEGHIAAMEKGHEGDRYILGGEDVSFNGFFDTLNQVSGKYFHLLRIPQKLIKAYSQVEWLKTKLTGLPPVFLPEFADRLNYDQKYTSNKAAVQLNYKITPFAEALERTVHYIKTRCN